MWKSFHWNDTMGERELRGAGNWRNSEKLNSSRAAWPWKRRWWKKGPKFKHFLLSCLGPIVTAWLLHRKEGIWHQRSQADNARKSVWLYVNISTCPRFPQPPEEPLSSSSPSPWSSLKNTWGCNSSSSSSSSSSNRIYMLHFPYNSLATVTAHHLQTGEHLSRHL